MMQVNFLPMMTWLLKCSVQEAYLIDSLRRLYFGSGASCADRLHQFSRNSGQDCSEIIVSLFSMFMFTRAHATMLHQRRQHQCGSYCTIAHTHLSPLAHGIGGLNESTAAHMHASGLEALWQII